MKLVFLYGPPAAGKLTVARELAALTGWRLFHNHLTVNLALALHDFGTPGFIALREQVWLASFRHALAKKIPVLIFTFSPENTVPQRFIDELFAEISQRGGEVIPVELTASEIEIERRIGHASRHREGKLVDVDLYRRLREAGAFSSPVVPGTRLRIDTAITPPITAARQIQAIVA